MTLTSHRRNFADLMGLHVKYAGETSQKMFAFQNGSALVTDLYPTLDEAIERFGNRIETGGFKYSGPYKDGLNAAMNRLAYAPVRALGKQAVLEYGTGYIAGMLERGSVPVPAAPDPIKIVELTSPVSPEPSPVVITEPNAGWENAQKEPDYIVPVVVAHKKRGRPRKQEMELL